MLLVEGEGKAVFGKGPVYTIVTLFLNHISISLLM